MVEVSQRFAASSSLRRFRVWRLLKRYGPRPGGCTPERCHCSAEAYSRIAAQLRETVNTSVISGSGHGITQYDEESLPQELECAPPNAAVGAAPKADVLAAPNAGVAGAPKAPGLPNAGTPPKPAVGCDTPKAGAVDPNAGAALTAPNAGCTAQSDTRVVFN